MKKIKYMLKLINKNTIKRLNDKINKVYEISHKPKIFIFFDIIWCMLIYQAGYTDYYSFGMYNMNHKQRKTILTRGKNNSYVAMFNNKKYWHIFDNKNEFNKRFDKYLKRDWLYLKDKNLKEFGSFIEDKNVIIAKPNNDSGGNGIEKIDISKFKNSKELYKYLKNKNLLLLEEVVEQHDILNTLNPTSVNTIRLITLKHNDKVHFITAFLRIGNNNSFVDNTASGGMLTMIDLKRGVTLFPAVDKNLREYNKHPITNTKIKGIEIPYFDKAKDMIKELSSNIKEINYIAWDIAITNNGPVIIEGNPYPGYYYQFPIHTPNKIGIIPVFNAILKNKDNSNLNRN